MCGGWEGCAEGCGVGWRDLPRGGGRVGRRGGGRDEGMCQRVKGCAEGWWGVPRGWRDASRAPKRTGRTSKVNLATATKYLHRHEHECHRSMIFNDT